MTLGSTVSSTLKSALCWYVVMRCLAHDIIAFSALTTRETSNKTENSVIRQSNKYTCIYVHISTCMYVCMYTKWHVPLVQSTPSRNLYSKDTTVFLCGCAEHGATSKGKDLCCEDKHSSPHTFTMDRSHSISQTHFSVPTLIFFSKSITCNKCFPLHCLRTD